MTRWWLALAIVAAFGGLLVASTRTTAPGASPAAAPDDELLAYELHPSRALLLKVPGGVDEIALTTWGVVARQGNYDPTTTYPYALKVEHVDPQQRTVGSLTFEPESRVSLRDPQGIEGRAAWLADASDWVTDSRTLSVTTSKRLPNGGFLRVEMLGGEVSAVLLRASFRENRSAIELEAHDRSLDLVERRKLMGLRSALGSDDLPPDARASALLSWARRLDAVGVEGRDFLVRRLLLADFRSALPPSVGAPVGFELGPRHAAAFNLQRPVRIDVVTPAGRDVRVLHGGSVVATEDRGDERVTTLDAPSTAPSTLVIAGATEPDVRARFVVRSSDASAQLGAASARPLDAGHAEIAPEVRALRFYTLDEARPVIARVAPGQRALRLVVRGELEASDTRTAREARVTARWSTGRGAVELASVVVRLDRSTLDRWHPPAALDNWRGKPSSERAPGADATESRAAILGVPAGVEQVELLGEASLRVSLFADDPRVADDQLSLPYRVPLAEREAWRNAPHDLTHWARILPANAAALEEEGRRRDLGAQVRIETAGAGEAPLPERGVDPQGSPMQRHLLEPSTWDPGTPWPADAWTPVVGPSTWVHVEKSGPHAGELAVTYVADEARLGAPAKLLVGGAAISQHDLMVRGGEFHATLTPGDHEIALDGLGANGEAYTNAHPRARGAVVRRRVFSELSDDQPAVLVVAQPAGTPLTVVLFVATEHATEPWSLRYEVDEGRLRDCQGKFFRVTTRPSGTLAGQSGDAGTGSFWEAAEGTGGRRGVSKTKLVLGDDAPGGSRTVRVSLDGASRRLWLRALVVGEPEPAPVDGVRMWVED